MIDRITNFEDPLLKKIVRVVAVRDMPVYSNQDIFNEDYFLLIKRYQRNDRVGNYIDTAEQIIEVFRDFLVEQRIKHTEEKINKSEQALNIQRSVLIRQLEQREKILTLTQR